MDIPIPEDDADRVAALRAYGILDSNKGFFSLETRTEKR